MSPANPERQSATSKMCLVCQRRFDASFSICPHDQSNLVRLTQEESFIGRSIADRYTITEKIGQGGMGTVYLAEDGQTSKRIAIKLLKAQLSEDRVSVKRFEQEARTSLDLQHPNLIAIYDFGTYQGKQPYLVMEYLQGESLADIIKQDGPLNPVRCCRIFSQVMDALHYAHNKGVVHRDVKPSNIILVQTADGSDQVKVVDFGLAKLMPWSGKESQHLTKTGEVFGSPIYMSPEQCMGKRLEPSSDIYSLSITLFEALTGKPPFKGKNVVETASQHMNAAPPTFDAVKPELNLSEGLQAVVFKALEKEPAHRYLSMMEFKSAMTQAILGPGANEGIRLPPPLADATQPVKRLDADSLHPQHSSSKITVSELKMATSKRGVHPGLIVAAIGLAGVLGGGAWLFFSKTQPTGTAPAPQPGNGPAPTREAPKEIRGVISYVELSPGPQGYSIDKLHVLGGGKYKGPEAIIPVDKAALYRPGFTCKFTASAGKATDLSAGGSTGTPDGPHRQQAPGMDALDDYFKSRSLCPEDDNSLQEARNLLSDRLLTKTAEEFKKEAQEAPNRPLVNTVALFRMLEGSKQGFDPFGQTAPPNSIKIAGATENSLDVICDNAKVYTRGKTGYERISLVKQDGRWKIDSMAPALKEEWDKY